MKIARQKNKKRFILPTLIILGVSVVSYGAYAYVSGNLWPFNDSNSTQSTDPTLPKIEDSNTERETTIESQSSESLSTEENSGSVTKTRGKTPTQYENEQVDDEPAYNNEQFRIPEENDDR